MENSTINTSGTLDEPRTDKNVIVTWYVVLMCIVMISGTFGNLLVIGAVIVHKPLRTTGNIFVVNLAIADLWVTAFVDPFSIVGAVQGSGIFLEWTLLCDAVAIACVVSCTCSLFTIAAIAVNRYIVICRNAIYADIFSYKRTIIYCVILWILSIGMDLPNLLGWGGHRYDPKMMICTFNRVKNLSYTIFLWSVNVCSPLLFVSICYLRIYTFVRRSNQKLKCIAGTFATVTNKRRTDELQLTKTLFMIFFAFLVCWVPLVVVIIYDTTDSLSKLIYNIALLSAHASSSINSLIYAATNKKFNKGYKTVLQKAFCCVIKENNFTA